MAEDERQQEKAKMPWRVRFALFSLIVAAAVFFSTTILLCGCLIPSVVAAIVDNHRQKTAWITIGCMNFVGTVPAWFALWEMGHHVENALALLSQPRTLIMAYGAAGVGWIIYLNITPFVARLLAIRSERRLKDIDRRQKDLVRKWGQEVAKY